jgi:hypothetical protein
MPGRYAQFSIVVDTPVGAGASHGLRKLQAALNARNIPVQFLPDLSQIVAGAGGPFMVFGPPDSPAVQYVAGEVKASLPTMPEALVIRRLTGFEDEGWLVSGGDDRGMMYALLEIVERIGWSSNPAEPFSEVHDAEEAPAVRERSLSIYTMQKADFERRFFDPAYWDRYLDMLARSRFNTFTLILGYENAGYFAPPYPYFFDVDGFPDVRVVGMTAQMQQAYLAALNRLIAQVHGHGLDFVLAIWDHIYRAGVQSGGVDAAAGDDLPWRVAGVTQDNLMAYSVAAMDKLLQQVPHLDGLQFRMHDESGLAHAEMDTFWATIYDVIMARAPHLRFDARAKEFPDSLIDLALEKGVKIRLCTKYWMEQMGLPFHPTHIHPQNQHDRRHGYADLLRYPRRYSMLWRLWNGGTSRVLLWGDPEYARRFAESTGLYDGDGFDVNEPLATKMASHDHEQEPFELLNPAYRHYEWEFERYWHFYQVFGRVGYSPEAPSELWEREFARRFGPEAGPHVMRGLHLASRILPRIVAYTYPYSLFPTTRGWVEKQRMCDLPTYAAALPSDTQQFLSIAEEARNRISGATSPKIRPQVSAAWFDHIAQQVLEEVSKAEAVADSEFVPTAELTVTLTDLRILAHLAHAHARRAQAGVHFALFEQTQDLNALDAAIAYEADTITAWEALVTAAGDVYADDLMMGLDTAGLSGHWRDELAALHRGLDELEAQRDAFRPPDLQGSPWIAHVPARRGRPGETLVLRATVASHTPVVAVSVWFGSDPDHLQAAPLEAKNGLRYEGTLPGTAVLPGLLYTLEAVDASGERSIWPESGEPVHVTVTNDDRPPEIRHTPVTTADPGNSLVLRATVRGASGVAWVRVRYRSVTQFEDYRAREMQPTEQPDVYEAAIPAGEMDPGWDFMYLIEAMDHAGNGTLYPDLEIETPYIVVRLQR